MFIFGCEVELIIRGAGSLKEKRSVVKSITDRIKNRYKISIVESGDQNLINKAKIGFCYCALYEKEGENKLDDLILSIESNGYGEIISITRDVFRLDGEDLY